EQGTGNREQGRKKRELLMGWVRYEHTLLLTSCLNNYGMRSHQVAD
ncbi:MAG: hypothetical protein F6K56_34715, partial [Moorea sp. SIO3G5]|nr:hypothetical protein [Moorena sp. SIO3G5]